MEVQRMENNLEIDLLYERLVEIEDNEYLHNKIVNESKKEINLIYSEIEQEYLDFVKNSKYSCSLYCIAQCINLSLIERENGLGKYLLIQSYKYNNLFGGNGNLYWGNSSTSEVIIINEDFSIYTNVRGKIIPLTYYYLSNQYIFNITKVKRYIIEIFNFFSERHLLFKELTEEFKVRGIYTPIKINDILKYKTKYDVLNKYCIGYEIPKSINKYPIQLAYLLIKCQKYVLKNEYQKLLKLSLDSYNNYCFQYKQKKQIEVCFFLYYKISIENEIKRELSKDEEIILSDYIYMKLEYDKKEKFNLKIKSIKRIKNEHDSITIKLRNKDTPKVVIPKNSRFNMLKLPGNFERIRNRKRLITESVIQNNCVWSYAKNINKDRSAIYSTEYKDKRYTIEIKRKSKTKYYLAQISGYGNSEAPNELIEKINQYLS